MAVLGTFRYYLPRVRLAPQYTSARDFQINAWGPFGFLITSFKLSREAFQEQLSLFSLTMKVPIGNIACISTFGYLKAHFLIHVIRKNSPQVGDEILSLSSSAYARAYILTVDHYNRQSRMTHVMAGKAIKPHLCVNAFNY